MELNHGGDWAGFQEKYGKLPLDLSASTTPLPMPEEMRAADLLFRLVLAKRPRRAMIVEPTFSGYGEALRTVNCQMERFFSGKRTVLR